MKRDNGSHGTPSTAIEEHIKDSNFTIVNLLLSKLRSQKRYLHEALKYKIAKIAWAIYLWAMDTTEAELLADLQEEAAREYKSEKATAWMQN